MISNRMRRAPLDGAPATERTEDCLAWDRDRTFQDNQGGRQRDSVPESSLPAAAGRRPIGLGFQLIREIKRKDEENDVWAPMSRDVAGFMQQMVGT